MLLKPYGEYYDEYAEKVAELLEQFPLGQPIVGEAAQKEFIALFGAILRLQNILTSFDDFAGNEILTERQGQDYRSVYLDLYAEFRKRPERREGVDQRRRRLRDRADQAGRDQRRLHPHARPEVPRRTRRRRRTRRSAPRSAAPSTPARRCATRRTSSRTSSTRVSADGEIDEEWRAFIAAKRDGRARRDHRRRGPRARRDPSVHRARLPRRRDPDDRHRDHQDPAAGLALLAGRRPRREEAARARPSSARSSSGSSGSADPTK